jgi:uncharacterized protein with HEPN domain
MPRDYKVYLEDIAEAISKIRIYLSGLDWTEAAKDSKTYDAVIRNLMINGEAVKNLPPEYKNSEPDIQWQKIGGFRDVLSHQYFGIDEAIIRDVIVNKLPELEKVVLKSL